MSLNSLRRFVNCDPPLKKDVASDLRPIDKAVLMSLADVNVLLYIS